MNKTNLEVAKEPDAYLCLDDTGKPYGCKLTVEKGEKFIPLYTSRIYAEKDAEIARLRDGWFLAESNLNAAKYNRTPRPERTEEGR